MRPQTISSKTGEQWIETNQFSQLSLVSTNKVIRFSQILGRWTEGGTHNSLVAIDRAQAASDMRARIQEQDEIVRSQAGKSEAESDAVQRLKYARAAVEAFVSLQSGPPPARAVARAFVDNKRNT